MSPLGDAEEFVSLHKKTMKYGYIRISSDKQTVENQRYEIKAFCAKEGWQIDGYIDKYIDL